MNPRSLIIAALLTLIAAAAVFTFKYEVRGLEAKRQALQNELDREYWRLQLARAELEYLRRPERLAAQASQLDMVAATAERIIEPVMIGRRQELLLANNPLAVALPSGALVKLRARPALPPGLDQRLLESIAQAPASPPPMTGPIRVVSQ